jgi:hypothetical protein
MRKEEKILANLCWWFGFKAWEKSLERDLFINYFICKLYCCYDVLIESVLSVSLYMIGYLFISSHLYRSSNVMRYDLLVDLISI